MLKKFCSSLLLATATVSLSACLHIPNSPALKSALVIDGQTIPHDQIIKLSKQALYYWDPFNNVVYKFNTDNSTYTIYCFSHTNENGGLVYSSEVCDGPV